jgi:putative endonuclease
MELIITLYRQKLMRLHRKSYSVYILTNYNRTVLYTGVTNDLEQRIIEHYLNSNKPGSFTGKYKTFYLLYYEDYKYVNEAIAREKEIKGWRRSKKEELIKTLNPDMIFLNVELFEKWPPDNMFSRSEL